MKRKIYAISALLSSGCGFDHVDLQNRLQRANIKIPENVNYIKADFTQKKWEIGLIDNVRFYKKKISFCSLLGLSYYLTKQDFSQMISVLSSFLQKGSSLVFDYPDEDSYTEKAGDRAKKQAMLAKASGEEMLSGYTYLEMERLLADHDFFIYEHVTPEEMTKEYFAAYNSANPSHQMTAFDNVNYCLAVKR